MMIARNHIAKLLAFGLLSFATPLSAQMGPNGGPPPGPIRTDPSVKTTYVRLGSARGVLYEPVTSGPNSRIALFLMHDSADYTSFSPCEAMARRGYRILCGATSAGSAAGIDRILLEAKTGVSYLKSLPGVDKVVLFGHSGGATLMTAYQAIAENGVAFCQGPEKLWKCPDSLTGMPAADGVVLADPNWGIAEMTLFSIDPSVAREDSGKGQKPDLDPFNPANGYNREGSHYSADFVRRFQKAQGEREMRLIASAQQRLAAIAAGEGRYADDEPFDIAGGSTLGPNNKLFPYDMRLMAHTRKAWPLLRSDGSAVTQIIPSVRMPMGTSSLTPTLGGGALRTTVRTFLSTFAIRVTPDYGFGADGTQGIDWTSTYSSPPGNVQAIHVPLLTMGMTGNWEYLASETIYEKSASKDKSIAFVEGASHMFSACTKCEKTPGAFGDTQETLFNFIDRWLSEGKRF